MQPIFLSSGIGDKKMYTAGRTSISPTVSYDNSIVGHRVPVTILCLENVRSHHPKS